MSSLLFLLRSILVEAQPHRVQVGVGACSPGRARRALDEGERLGTHVSQWLLGVESASGPQETSAEKC